jgi:hypothetical protein
MVIIDRGIHESGIADQGAEKNDVISVGGDRAVEKSISGRYRGGVAQDFNSPSPSRMVGYNSGLTTKSPKKKPFQPPYK